MVRWTTVDIEDKKKETAYAIIILIFIFVVGAICGYFIGVLT